MGTAFSDRSARVLAIEPVTAARATLSDVTRSLSFNSVRSVATAQDALGILEVEPIDWLISPLLNDQPVNAFHLLELCTKYEALRGIKTTLLLDQSELDVLPSAFALGLFSWATKPFTKDSLTETLQKLLTTLEENHWDCRLTAASYLRAAVNQSVDYAARLAFEYKLLDLYPGNVSLLMKTAEAQLLTRDYPRARASLLQARLLEPACADAAGSLFQQYAAPETLDEGAASPGFNVLGLKTCLIIDSDETICRAAVDALREIGVEKVEAVGNGEAALGWLKDNGEPSLIIHEWRLHKVPGPVLMQRVRQMGYHSVPLVVLSSLIQPQDLPLTREMGVANVIPKPFDKKEFLTAIVWTVQQDRLPTEQKTVERKLRQLLAAGKKSEAYQLKSTYLKDEKVPAGKKHHVTAEFAYHEKNYALARDAAIEALKAAGDSLFTLNLLGKALMQLRDFQSALKFFERAQALSPLNVERLCAIAEAHSELGQDDLATAALDQAKAIDHSSKTVVEAEAKVTTNTGDIERARAVMGQLDSLEGFVSYMNNRAVALARSGSVDGSLELYERALAAIPAEKSDVRAVLQYNFGLAYVRLGSLDEAKFQLAQAATSKDPRLQKKAESLHNRVAVAIEKREILNLRERVSERDTQPAKTDEPATETEAEGIAVSEAAKPGDICCHLLYQVSNPDPRISKLLATPPRFKPRAGIGREKTFGLENMAKTGAA